MIVSKNNDSTQNIAFAFSVLTVHEYQDWISKKTVFHQHHHYAMILIQSGTGMIEIDLNQYFIQSGSVLFINYDQVRKIQLSDAVEGHAILFTKEYYDIIFTGNPKIKSDKIFQNLTALIQLDPKDYEDWIYFVHYIKKEKEVSNLYHDEIICLFLKIFALQYYRQALHVPQVIEKSNRQKELIDNFTNLIELYYKKWKMPKQYAQVLFISPSYLNALCQKHFKLSASKVIQNRILLEAKRLLLHSTLSIREVGFELGFEYKSHFNKYFKSIADKTPNSFRKSTLNKD